MIDFQGFIIDLDDTLYDYKTSNRIALQYTFEQISKIAHKNLNNVEETFLIARSQINNELNFTAASHNRLLYFQRMYELWNINPVYYSLDAYNCYWSTLLDNITVNDYVYEFLDSLKGKKVCILTDLTAHIQHRKIKKLGLEHYIDYLVTSEEAGREKPHPYMFMMAARKMNLSFNQVCMIGDSYKKDILGAKQLKIEGFWFNPFLEDKELLPQIHSFKSFNELINWG